MDLYKPICKHIVIPLWARWERSPYLKHLQYLQKSQYFSLDKIREYQLEKIRNLLRHAYDNCSYYRRRFRDSRVEPEDIRSFDDYLRVPLLTKDDVRTFQNDLIAPGFDRYCRFLTSGSTGKPLVGYRDKACNEFKRACGIRSDLWSGYDLGERIYCLYGNPEKELRGLRKTRALLRRKMLRRVAILDMLSLTRTSMLAFAEKMRRKPPSLLWGHAHGLYLLASFCKAEKILDIRPKGMYSAGMVLHDFERRTVEEVFHCKLQDRYGCEELGLIAAECKEQQGLHINTDAVYVEFLGKDGKHVSPGERGLLVVTDLTNHVMPFIRYRLEDVGIPSDKKCPCGRTQPLIEKIEGRVADFLVTPRGQIVSGISLTDHFAGHIPGVDQIQIVQETVDFFTLNIVKGRNFDESSLQAISRLIQDFFGPEMKYTCQFVAEIGQGRTGKYQFTISKVSHDLF